MQEAHLTQGRLVRKLEARVCEAGQTLETVKAQEKVIMKLEGLLKQAAQERRAAMATAEKLQQQLAGVESQLDTANAQVSSTAYNAIYLDGHQSFAASLGQTTASCRCRTSTQKHFLLSGEGSKVLHDSW